MKNKKIDQLTLFVVLSLKKHQMEKQFNVVGKFRGKFQIKYFRSKRFGYDPIFIPKI